MTDHLYKAIVAAGIAALDPGEKYIVYHPDGPFEMTASEDFTQPVRIVCQALDADWDELVEQGYYLGKWKP